MQTKSVQEMFYHKSVKDVVTAGQFFSEIRQLLHFQQAGGKGKDKTCSH